MTDTFFAEPVLAIVFLMIIAALFAAVVALAFLPGRIARDRGHPSAEAIRICGLVGLLIWPCWIIAYIWAHTGPDRSAENTEGEPDYHLGIQHPQETDSAFTARSRRDRHRA